MSRTGVRVLALAFLGGAIGVLAFHQAFVLLAYALGRIPTTLYSMASTPPLGVPKVISLAFWGGVWGPVMIPLLRRIPESRRLAAAFLFGGIFPTLVGVLVVGTLKGQALGAGLTPQHLLFGFVINGIWGLGTLLAYRWIAGRVR
jgi:hypothetical protein